VGDAAHGRFCWPRKALSPRRFLVDSFSRRPPSRIPNWQGTLISIRVASWRRVDIASSLFSWRHLKRALVSSQHPSWQPNRLMFTLVWIALRRCVAFTFALWWEHIKLSLALLRRHLDFTPGHTLRPGYPTRRAWQPWLSQLCQRVRRQWFPRPGLVQHPRPATLPLICAHQCPGFNFPTSRSRRQQARKCQWPQGSQVGCPVLTTLSLRVFMRVRGFEGLGQMSMARHSEPAPSPGGFSHARVSGSEGENGKN